MFWETVPAQYLPLALWLEADRMATLRIDKDTFTNEREVVKEERRMRIDNQPYGRLNEIIYDQAFTSHPYKHPTIGSMEDLEAASVDDVRDFYHTYYVPEQRDAGARRRLRSAQALQLVTQYLGPRAEGGPRRCRATFPQEPPQTKEKRVTLQEPWPLPAVVVAYHITYDGNPDSYPLHIAAKVLSDGDARASTRSSSTRSRSRWRRSASANLIEDPNLFYAVAIVQPGHTPEEVQRSADRRARSAEDRADHASTSCSARRTSSRATTSSAASRSAEGAAARARRRHPQRHQDGGRRVRHLPEHHRRRRAARGADVLHAGESRLVLTVMPTGRRAQPEATDEAAAPGVSAIVRGCSRARRAASSAQPGAAVAAERAAAPLAARDIKFPPYEIQTLPNGLQVVVVLHHEQPAVSMRLLVRAGAARIRADKLGSRASSASLLDQGTTTRSAAGDERRDRLHRRRDGRRRGHRPDASSTSS